MSRVFEAVVESTFGTMSRCLIALTLLSGACFLPAAMGAETGKENSRQSERALASERTTKAREKQKGHTRGTITEAEHWDYAIKQKNLAEAGKITEKEARRRCAASKEMICHDKKGITEEEYHAAFAAIQKRLDAGKISADKAHRERIALRGKASIFRIFRTTNPKLQLYCECEKTAYDAVETDKMTEDKAVAALKKMREHLWPKGKDEYRKYKLERTN